MNKLRELKDDFIDSLPNDFLAKSKNIMTKGVTTMLALSISTGAMASTVEALQKTHQDNNVNIQEILEQDIQDSFEELSEKNKNYPSGIQSGIQVENPEHLYDLNEHNFKYIIDHKVSGVYAHPLIEGEVITYYFNDDPRGDKVFDMVSNQLHDLGLDSKGFATEYRAHAMITGGMEMVGKTVPSHHMQMTHELYDDPNLTYMSIDSKANGSNAEEIKHNEDVYYISNLYTMYHEAFHAVGKKLDNGEKPDLNVFQKMFGIDHITSEIEEDGQQMSLLDNLIDGHVKTVKAESQSFAGGHLMAYIMSQNPDANISKEAFMQNFNADVVDSNGFLMAKGHDDPHLYAPAYQLLNKMFENNHDEIMAMAPTAEEPIPTNLVKLSNRIAIESVTFDFYPEVERRVERDAVKFFEELSLNMDDAKNRNFGEFNKVKYIDKLVDHFEKTIDNIDWDNAKPKELDIIEQFNSLKILQENPELLDDYKGFVQAKIDHFVENELDGNKSIKLGDIDYKHHLAHIPMDSFVEHVEQTSEFKETIGHVVSNDDWRTIVYEPKQPERYDFGIEEEFENNQEYTGDKKIASDDDMINDLKNEVESNMNKIDDNLKTKKTASIKNTNL